MVEDLITLGMVNTMHVALNLSMVLSILDAVFREHQMQLARLGYPLTFTLRKGQPGRPNIPLQRRTRSIKNKDAETRIPKL